MERIEAIYYDSFTNEYCLPSEKELNIAPPERYLRTLKNLCGFYVEHWKVSGSVLGDRLDVAYSSPEFANHVRFELAEKNKCKLSYILWWEIPADKFNEYVRTFGLAKKRRKEKEK